MRADMSEIEEGKAIQKIMETYEFSQRQVSKKIGKSQFWVNSRLSLVLRIVKEVQVALSKNLISAEHASLISQINEYKFVDWENKQREFLGLIIKNKLFCC